jgi:hypothetical protein
LTKGETTAIFERNLTEPQTLKGDFIFMQATVAIVHIVVRSFQGISRR